MSYENGLEKNDIHEDMCRAWRKGLTLKQIIKKYGGSREYVANVVRNTKRKYDISKNNILIVRDRKRDPKDMHGRPRTNVRTDK